jgi:hypothetical protein
MGMSADITEASRLYNLYTQCPRPSYAVLAHVAYTLAEEYSRLGGTYTNTAKYWYGKSNEHADMARIPHLAVHENA